MALLLLHVAHMNLINKPVLALRRDLRLRGIGLVRPNVVVLQGGEHGLHSLLHFRGIVAGAVARQQELQDEGGYVRALFNPMQKILPDDFAIESGIQFLIKSIHEFLTLRNWSLG